MLRQYLQQHIVDRTADPAALALVPPPGTKPGDSTKQQSSQRDSSAPSPTSRPSLSPLRCCSRQAALTISIAPALRLNDMIKPVGQRTDGFSGRELSKLVLKLQVGDVMCLTRPSGYVTTILFLRSLRENRVLCTAPRASYSRLSCSTPWSQQRWRSTPSEKERGTEAFQCIMLYLLRVTTMELASSSSACPVLILPSSWRCLRIRRDLRTGVASMTEPG
jgi:hypothetical protein